MRVKAGNQLPTLDTENATQGDEESRRRSEAMDFFSARFGIRSAFVRVKTLSRLLGIGEGTIYSAMRAGTFFMPHRMLGIAPAVKLEDLVDWYCQSPDAVDRMPSPETSQGGAEATDEEPADPMESTVAKKERRKAIIEAALAEMNKVR